MSEVVGSELGQRAEVEHRVAQVLRRVRVQAEDNDTKTELWYDSLSRQTEDKQSVATGADRMSAAQSLSSAVVGHMKRAFDGVGNLRRQIYPSAAVTINRTVDAANRLTLVQDGSTSIASYKHIGMGARRLSRTYSTSGVKLTNTYDGNRRVVRHDHVKASSNQRIRGFGYAWDRVGNRRFERHLTVNTNPNETGGPGDFYRYDSAYRLVHVDQDVSSSVLNGITNNRTTVSSPIPALATSSDFVYDAAGNRKQTSINGSTKLYELRAGLPELDAAVNQYTRVGSTYQTHDLNGNTLSSSELGLQRFFDANDQLVQWTEGSKDVRYRYDVLGRRVSKRMASGGSTHTLYFYDGWQDAEETNSSGTVLRAYVYGEGIDEVLRATLPDVLDLDAGSTVELFYHDNSLGSVVALTTVSGTVVESYRYEAFGKVSIFDQSGQVVSTTRVEQPFMFTGRRLDWEEGSGLYYYRLRYYDPAAGRFVSRDPLGMWGDPGQNGNGQNYCGNNPANLIDPFGLDDTGAGSPPGDDTKARELTVLKEEVNRYYGWGSFSGFIFRLTNGILSPSGTWTDYQRLGLKIKEIEGDIAARERAAAALDKNWGALGVCRVSMGLLPPTAAAEGLYIAGHGTDIEDNPASRVEGALVFGMSTLPAWLAAPRARTTLRPRPTPVPEESVPLPQGSIEVYQSTLREMQTAELAVIRENLGPYSVVRQDQTLGQAHHLNQNAVYRSLIPPDEGVSLSLRGNAFTEIGSPHYNAHASLEAWWNQFRPGGSRHGQVPTNLEYSQALAASLRSAGLSRAQALEASRAAIRQRIQAGAMPWDKVPRIPGRINQAR